MVVFYDRTTSLGAATLDSTGTATLATAALTLIGSPHSITAVYDGDSTFAGSTSAVLTQCIACSSDMVTIPLVNPSFEIPAVAQGATAGTATGWIASLEGSYGVYNPAAGVYTNVVNDMLPTPADGSQVLFIQAGNYLAQFLTNTLAPNQTYTLSGAIGNRGDGFGLAPGDTDYVNLLAGSAIIAQCTNLPHPNPGGFLPWAVSYTAGASGFPSGTLQIQLGQQGTGEVHYDNISLTAADPPARPQIMAADAGFGFLAGQFGFDLSAAVGKTVVVDGSTDLVDWTPLYTNTAGAGAFYFSDPLSTSLPWRFYRARSQ